MVQVADSPERTGAAFLTATTVHDLAAMFPSLDGDLVRDIAGDHPTPQDALKTLLGLVPTPSPMAPQMGEYLAAQQVASGYAHPQQVPYAQASPGVAARDADRSAGSHSSRFLSTPQRPSHRREIEAACSSLAESIDAGDGPWFERIVVQLREVLAEKRADMKKSSSPRNLALALRYPKESPAKAHRVAGDLDVPLCGGLGRNFSDFVDLQLHAVCLYWLDSVCLARLQVSSMGIHEVVKKHQHQKLSKGLLLQPQPLRIGDMGVYAQQRGSFSNEVLEWIRADTFFALTWAQMKALKTSISDSAAGASESDKLELMFHSGRRGTTLRGETLLNHNASQPAPERIGAVVRALRECNAVLLRYVLESCKAKIRSLPADHPLLSNANTQFFLNSTSINWMWHYIGVQVMALGCRHDPEHIDGAASLLAGGLTLFGGRVLHMKSLAGGVDPKAHPAFNSIVKGRSQNARSRDGHDGAMTTQTLTPQESLRITMREFDMSGVASDKLTSVLEHYKTMQKPQAGELTTYIDELRQTLEGFGGNCNATVETASSYPQVPGQLYIGMPASFKHSVEHKDDKLESLRIPGGDPRGYKVAVMLRSRCFRSFRGTIKANPPELYRIVAHCVATELAHRPLEVPSLQQCMAQLL